MSAFLRTRKETKWGYTRAINTPVMNLTIAAFSGSLRRESFNTKLVKAFQKLAPSGVNVDIIDIGRLPLINEDLEADLGALEGICGLDWPDFRQTVKSRVVCNHPILITLFL
jgi:hypothetical protein